MTKASQSILEDAVSYIFDKYGSDQIADLHLEIDGTPDEPFFELLTLKLAETRPDLFNQVSTLPVES